MANTIGIKYSSRSSGPKIMGLARLNFSNLTGMKECLPKWQQLQAQHLGQIIGAIEANRTWLSGKPWVGTLGFELSPRGVAFTVEESNKLEIFYAIEGSGVVTAGQVSIAFQTLIEHAKLLRPFATQKLITGRVQLSQQRAADEEGKKR